MPGLIVFGRRWLIGSDDLVVPSLILIGTNGIWLVIFIVMAPQISDFKLADLSGTYLWHQVIGNIAVLSSCIVVETGVALVSIRGTILNSEPRAKMELLLYVRLVLMLMQLTLSAVSIAFLLHSDTSMLSWRTETALLGLSVMQLIFILSVLITVGCTYDPAGRRWVRLKRYQQSFSKSDRKFKRSGLHSRNWRKRKLILSYQNSWLKRFHRCCCCIGSSAEQDQTSFAEVAKLFSEFFSDLDAVPTDILVGLLLLRKKQKFVRDRIIDEASNDTYQFLSGAAINPRTKFLRMSEPADLELVETLRYYMQFALGAYGWPFYIAYNSGRKLCRIFGHLSCCACCCQTYDTSVQLESDNCCRCDYAALKLHLPSTNIDIIYATFHVAINETPFYVAVDHDKRTVVICARGTLSLQDVITDLSAQSEEIPLQVPRRDWLAHKGTLKAALHMYKHLESKNLITKAYQTAESDYQLLLVGHSLGAGAATILGILLRDKFPNLHVYGFAPPGGLLTKAACEYTKEFVTSVVVGKDVVVRLGLAQLETLRCEIFSLLRTVEETKWRIILRSMSCCRFGSGVESETLLNDSISIGVHQHPTNANISLTTHEHLYPAGRILHIVRTWTKTSKKQRKPIFTAIWAENDSFDEVLISPNMVQDHMPDGVIHGIDMLLQSSEELKCCYSGCATKSTFTPDPSSHLGKYSSSGMVLVAPLATPEWEEISHSGANLLSESELSTDICSSIVILEPNNNNNGSSGGRLQLGLNNNYTPRGELSTIYENGSITSPEILESMRRPNTLPTPTPGGNNSVSGTTWPTSIETSGSLEQVVMSSLGSKSSASVSPSTLDEVDDVPISHPLSPGALMLS